MADFLILLLSMSVSGSILVLLLWGLRPVLGRRLSGAWMYYIWIIVALRMLLPFTPEQGLLNRFPGSLGAVRQESAVAGGIGSQSTLMSDNSGMAEDRIGNADLQDTSSREMNDIQEQEGVHAGRPEDVRPGNGFFSFLSGHLADAVPAVLFFIWLTGAIFLFLRAALASRIFPERIRRGAFPVDSAEINACYEKTCGRLSIRRPPQLLGSTEAISPMLTGLLKPAIVLPVSVLQHPENLSFIFRHELIHYKRKDIWFKWLFQLVECVHFFNPFAYLLRRQVERCCELSCDEAVVKDMTFQERKAYGTTLLDALERGIFPRTPAASASLCENAAFIKERLVMIKMNKKKSTFIKVITPLLTTGICFGAFYLGACAAPADSSPAGNAVPASLSKQSQTSGPGSLTELSAAVNTPSSSKKPASYTDAEAPDGFTLLKTETASLDSVRNLKLLLSFEDVTLYPTADNTVTMLFSGNHRITYAKDEIASLRQTSGSVSLESGKMNKAWSRLSSDKWQPKVYIYLPADFAGNLQVQIGSGSLQSTTNLQAASASFETASGKMVLGDVGADGQLALTNHSGSTSAGSLSGEQCVLDNASGKLTTGIITSLKAGSLTNASGKLTVGNITAGQCSIENMSGNLNLGLLDISGSLKLTNVSGPVSGGQITAKEYTVSTGSGRMEIQSLAGTGSLTSGSGSIRAGSLALTGALTMETGSGSIHAAIPENTGIDLTIASVGSGSINTFFSIPDYKKADSGTSARYGNGPYHPVTVSAGSGSINLEKQ